MSYPSSWRIEARQMCHHCTFGGIFGKADNRSLRVVCSECVSYGGSDKLRKGKGPLWSVAQENQHPL
jgi:hypothetical protein